MDTPFDFNKIGEERLVYVRPVDVSELPRKMRDQAGGKGRIYAVHSSDGERLALVKDRKLHGDRISQNDFAPVNVH